MMMRGTITVNASSVAGKVLFTAVHGIGSATLTMPGKVRAFVSGIAMSAIGEVDHG